MGRDSDAPLTTLAGWTTNFQKGMLRLYLHPIPRPFSYRTQLRSDVRAYKPWLIWLWGGGLIVWGVYALRQPEQVGFFASGWLKIETGAGLLLFWLYGLTSVVRWTRTAPLEVGLIQSVKPLPPFPDLVRADATQADGTVVEVTMRRALVDGFMKEHGECEVLYYKRRYWGDRKNSGFAFAARPRLDKLGPSEQVGHWTSMPARERLELQQTARRAGYPIDAVFFVLSVLGGATGRHGHGDARPATAHEICRFVPEHAAQMFGGPGRATKVLSAWGLRTGDDIGAIVAACVDAGWLKAGPGESADDFRGIDVLPALREERPE
jgi:uncharacterized repeat protein (TIGR04138 family)